MEEALERMKTALRDAQSNLSMAQERMKRAVDKKRRTEDYKVGDEVVLSTANLRTYCPHIPQKNQGSVDRPLSHHQGGISSCVRIGSTPGLADPSRLPCKQT